MGCLKSSMIFIARGMLYIINTLLLIFGGAIMVIGIYYLCKQQEYKRFYAINLHRDTDVNREVGLFYMVPAVIMILYSCVGLHGAGRKVVSLVLYSAATLILLAVDIYGICSLGLDHNMYSLYSYINKVHDSLDPKRITGFVYLEFVLQIALLALCVYLIYLHYRYKIKMGIWSRPRLFRLQKESRARAYQRAQEAKIREAERAEQAMIQEAERAQEAKIQEAERAQEAKIQAAQRAEQAKILAAQRAEQAKIREAERAQEEEANEQKALLQAEAQKHNQTHDGLKIYIALEHKNFSSTSRY